MVYFEMFTEEGEQACNEALGNIQTLIKGDKFLSEAELKNFVKEQIAQVDANHGEVHDTEPEWHFVDRINMALETRGYNYRIDRYDL